MAPWEIVLPIKTCTNAKNTGESNKRKSHLIREKFLPPPPPR